MRVKTPHTQIVCYKLAWDFFYCLLCEYQLTLILLKFKIFPFSKHKNFQKKHFQNKFPKQIHELLYRIFTSQIVPSDWSPALPALPITCVTSKRLWQLRRGHGRHEGPLSLSWTTCCGEPVPMLWEHSSSQGATSTRWASWSGSKPSDVCGLLHSSLKRNRVRTTQRSHSQVPSTQKLHKILNVYYCFMLLNLSN